MLTFLALSAITFAVPVTLALRKPAQATAVSRAAPAPTARRSHGRTEELSWHNGHITRK